MTQSIIKVFVSAAAIVGLSFPSLAGDSSTNFESLTLELAMEIAEQHHPDLFETRATLEAARARRAGAGRLPDPEAVARVESAPLRGRTGNSAEYVAGVSQSVPLGGRLGAAKEVADREQDAAAARVERTAREVRSRVHGAFATALYFDAARQGFSNNLSGARALTRITKARVEAGDTLRADLARAEMEEIQAGTEAKAAEAAWHLAISELAAAIGSSQAHIVSLQGSLDQVFALPRITQVLADSRTSPEVLVAEAEAAALRARVRLARAEKIPDVNFELFYRRLQETRQDAFDAGLRVPIPLFSRSGARVRETEFEATSAEARARSTRTSAQQALRRAVSELNRELDSAAVIKDEIIPRADLIAASAEVRYKTGDTSLTEVLQARRDLSAARTQYLQQLRAVHDSWRTLASLTPNSSAMHER